MNTTTVKTAPAELMACIDCYQWVAGISAGERGEEYPAATVDALADADMGRYVNACGDECDTCDTFSWSPCELCGSSLGGERHAVLDMRK